MAFDLSQLKTDTHGAPKAPAPADVAPGSPLDYALQYIDLGWPVLPLHHITRDKTCSCGDGDCASPGKHPRLHNGVKGASIDKDQARRWWAEWPEANVGVATGPQAGFWALDVDPRHLGDESLSAIEQEFGALPDTAIQLTGGGGFHYLFRYASATVKNRTGVFPGVDVRGAGGYICVEPSNHVSGGAYAWEGSSDPTEGHRIMDAPEWLLERVAVSESAAVQLSGEASQGPGWEFLTQLEQGEIQEALPFIPNQERDDWLKVGMALHSIDSGQAGFKEWTKWSQQGKGGEKYSAKDQARVWCSFSNRSHRYNKESIFFWAQQAGWVNPMTGTDEPVIAPAPPIIEEIKDSAKESATDTTAAAPRTSINPLPGALGDVVEWANKTAPIPQPLLAIQAALALGSVVAGRLYRTNLNNYPSLYFLNVAKSASGKEHAKSVIEECLAAAGQTHLLGGSGYTSSAAVFSSLMDKPAHITVIDEMGRMLATSTAAGNHHRVDAITALMEAFGRCHGVLRPSAYSTMWLSKAQREEAEDKAIQRPAITLIGMTTPGTFYEALSSAAVKDGFLGRFLVAESDQGRALTSYAPWIDPPASVSDWIQAVREAGGGNLAGIPTGADLAPQAIEMRFQDAAFECIRAFETERLALMDDLEPDGLDVLVGRAHEIAMRLSLIVALSRDPQCRYITVDDAGWCVDYVRQAMLNLVEAVKERVADSHDEAMINKVVGFVRDCRQFTNSRFAQTTRRGFMPRSYLLKLLKIKARDADAYLNTAIQSGDIAQGVATLEHHACEGVVYWMPADAVNPPNPLKTPSAKGG